MQQCSIFNVGLLTAQLRNSGDGMIDFTTRAKVNITAT